MRVIFLSLITGILLFLVLLSVRLWGLSQVPKDFDHPLFHQQKPWRAISYSLRDKALKTDIIWIDVIESKERNLFVLEKPLQASQIQYSENELAQFNPISLHQALEELSGHRILLNILSSTEQIEKRITSQLEKYKDDEVIIQSDYDAVISAIKEIKPLWLYGSSLGSKVRMRTFQSMWILPATSFVGDLYIGPVESNKVQLITQEVVNEIHRRKKNIFAGPFSNQEKLEQALRLGIDGVFIDQEALLGITSGL